MPFLAGEHDPEPPWLLAEVLLTSGDQPFALGEELLPESVFTLPALFRKELSEVGPKHESTLAFKDWNINSRKSTNNRFVSFGESSLDDLDVVLEPNLVLKHLSHQILGMGGCLQEVSEDPGESITELLVVSVADTNAESAEAKVFGKSTRDMAVVLKEVRPLLILLLLFDQFVPYSGH